MLRKYLGAVGLLVVVVATNAIAQTGPQYKIHFQQPYSQFENCLLEQFMLQSPIEFKHVEIAGSIHFGMDNNGNVNNLRIVVPLLAVTESNHPALLDLNLVAANDYVWTRVATGGLPIYLTPAVQSPVHVTDHVSRNRAYTVWQDCGMPQP